MLALYPADGKGTQIIDIWTEDGGFEYFYGNYGLCPVLQQYESVTKFTFEHEELMLMKTTIGIL